jgi:hypothetical protein
MVIDKVGLSRQIVYQYIQLFIGFHFVRDMYECDFKSVVL